MLVSQECCEQDVTVIVSVWRSVSVAVAVVTEGGATEDSEMVEDRVGDGVTGDVSVSGQYSVYEVVVPKWVTVTWSTPVTSVVV